MDYGNEGIELKLDAEQRRRIDRILVQRVRDAVTGVEQRDQDLAEYEDQLEGRLIPGGKQRWKNASVFNDPLSREAHIEFLALLTQAEQKSPPWTVEAVRPENTDDAALLEAWLTDKYAEYGLKRHHYDLAYNQKDDAAILYAGWAEKIRTQRRTMYRDVEWGEDAEILSAEERDPERLYDPVPVSQEMVEQAGCDFRVVDLADFYLYPPDAQSIKTAIGTAERMLLTEDQLLDGIDDYGYDADAVNALIRQGPTHLLDGNAFRDRRDLADGIEGMIAEQADGFYECFLYFGKLPKLRDGEGRIGIPKPYLRDDICAVLCPQRQSVVKRDLSPYADRPYIRYSILAKPNRFLGTGAMRLLAAIQDEVNARKQADLDSLNMLASPAFVASPDWIARYASKFAIYPGAVLPEETPGEIRPLAVEGNVPLGMAAADALVQRGKGLVAAQGYGQLDAKQRKNGEMQNVLQAADAKFDLYLANFQAGKEELAARIVRLHQRFAGDQEETIQYQGRPQAITPQALGGQYRFIPTATSSTSTPEMRLGIAEKKQQVQTWYLQTVLQAPPPFQALLWHTARQILLDLGERQPASCIGPEPGTPAWHSFIQPAMQQQMDQQPAQAGIAARATLGGP